MTVDDFHAEAVARFVADWEAVLRGGGFEPPPLHRYVPDGTEVRLAVLADLVRIDMRQRWRRTGTGKRITEYGNEFPEVADSPHFVELVCEEYLVRRRYRQVDLETFSAEYPELAGEIRARFADRSAYAPPSLPAHIDIGHRLDDFDLLTDLGGDERSRVFLARQLSMQRLVAVRVDTGADADAATVARLDHQYIVRVFDERHLEDGGKPLRLLYMQYLPGGTVADLLARLRRNGQRPANGAALLGSVDAVMEARGEIRPADSSVRTELAALSWPETVAWVGRRLAVALDYADRHGVPHHDIRPGTVLFTAEGVPKLADFGLASRYPDFDDSTADAVRLRYHSPEYLTALLDPAASMPDTRGDIYALGLLLWEMLTGTLPFADLDPDEPPAEDLRSGGARHGDGPAEGHPTSDNHAGDNDTVTPPGADRPRLIAAMLRQRSAGVPPAALDTLPADTPATLRRVLLECLHPHPDRRWRSGAELAGQLDLTLDARARDLVDPPPASLRRRARGWALPIATLCVGVPNVLASVYNIRLNQRLIVDRLAEADQQRFETVALVNNSIAFPLAALLLIWLCRRPLTVPFRLARGHEYSAAELARARADTLTVGDRAVLVPFAMWLLAGIIWPLALAGSGVPLAPGQFAHFFAAQVVCATIALAYPFFLITLFAVRSLYPQLLVRGGIGPTDGTQLWALARRSNFYLAAAASVPLLGAASATFVPATDLESVIVPVRWLSVGGILAFVITYWLFRLLEADLRALVRAIPRGVR
ncbi:protein kinase [Nocardia otitidiscaviarum]|uniref:Protein kinase n=1 Tax=Nocardia otitidiscaviarum TaxID=1823 RepID=A0A516NTI1_9NOCA|nr:protein kinase [Nocardia otitidiscaviarum]MCP9621531.1 protein kinase [Nocardia otitidiscaviarum]QDP82215.1 protein kinase [Nocardia otitidiscaviarum]